MHIHKTRSFSAEQRANLECLESVFVIYFSLVEDLQLHDWVKGGSDI